MATIGFVLIDGFAMLGFAAMIDPFHAASGQAAYPDYRLRTLSTGAESVRAANGVVVTVDGSIADDAMTSDIDILLLFSPRNKIAPGATADVAAMLAAGTEPLVAPLRRLAERGATIGGIGGGAWLMAQAGLLDGYAAVVHRDLQPMFAAAFPKIALERTAPYVIDRNRLSCNGGTACLDMATQLIVRDRSPDLAFVSPVEAQGAAPDGAPTDSLSERHGTTHRVLLCALAAMEAHVAEPLPRAALARAAGVSVRQLERLFQAHLPSTLDATYRHIRLDRALALVRGTGMSTAAIGAACGFTNASHFSRVFAQRFRVSPGAARKHMLGR